MGAGIKAGTRRLERNFRPVVLKTQSQAQNMKRDPTHRGIAMGMMLSGRVAEMASRMWVTDHTPLSFGPAHPPEN
jgi:hypothetical protein